MNRRPVLLIAFAVCLIALGVIGYLGYTMPSADTALPSAQASDTDGGNRANITLSKDDRTLGNPKAPITIVEYAALTCPHCAHFNEEMFPKLKAKYIDSGKVFYVFRVFPRMSMDLAAEALARCVPPQDYFKLVDLLFKNQLDWDPEYQPLDAHGGLLLVARRAGMSNAQADRCIQNKAALERANKVGADGETRYGINGTPTFVVNGKVHPGQYEWDDLDHDLGELLKTR